MPDQDQQGQTTTQQVQQQDQVILPNQVTEREFIQVDTSDSSRLNKAGNPEPISTKEPKED